MALRRLFTITLLISACTRNDIADSQPSCQPVGAPSYYRFSTVQLAQEYNCVFLVSDTTKKKCIRMLSLETAEYMESCNIPWWGDQS